MVILQKLICKAKILIQENNCFLVHYSDITDGTLGGFPVGRLFSMILESWTDTLSMQCLMFNDFYSIIIFNKNYRFDK